MMCYLLALFQVALIFSFQENALAAWAPGAGIIPPFPDDDCQIVGGRFNGPALATSNAVTAELCRQSCIDNPSCTSADWVDPGSVFAQTNPSLSGQCNMMADFGSNGRMTLSQEGWVIVMRECREYDFKNKLE